MRRVGSALLLVLACAEPRSEPQAQPTAMAAQQSAAPEPAIPPAVLQGDAELHCNISSSATALRNPLTLAAQNMICSSSAEVETPVA